MSTYRLYRQWVANGLALLAALDFTTAQGQVPQVLLTPTEVGQTVEGFQDDFEGTALGSAWLAVGLDTGVYSVAGGVLRVASARGDPNHLLLNAPGYSNDVQEVLARLRVGAFGTTDGSRCGISAAVDPASAEGISFLFRDLGTRHLSFLDDRRAWSTRFDFAWETNAWYWLRLRHDPTASTGQTRIGAKVWPADGTSAEPVTWWTWDYASRRTGLAGITASSGETAELEVDYILVKAGGLPRIEARLKAFPPTTPSPPIIMSQPQSRTVAEGAPVVFSIAAEGSPPFTFQWFKSEVLLPEATNYYCSFVAHLDDDQAILRVAVSNALGIAFSSNAVLTVNPDRTPPRLVSVVNLSLQKLEVGFSEPIESAAATNLRNYMLSGAVPILAVEPGSSPTNIILTTGPQVAGARYTLNVSGVRDRAHTPNSIEYPAQIAFVALDYRPGAVGDPAQAGGLTFVDGGYDVVGGGGDIGGRGDQFHFDHQQRTGNFDIKVKLQGLELSDLFAKAGLMARESLEPESRFVAALATPSLGGCFFSCRASPGEPSFSTGSIPVNYPETWLRLQRTGTVFNAYAGFDGQLWTMLGTASLDMPAGFYFGFAVGSHNTNQTTRAQFRSVESVTTATEGQTILPWEPLGPASRRTGLVISEIFYHPKPREDGKNPQFLELFNSQSIPESLDGCRLTGDANYAFPDGTVIPAGGFLVVAPAPQDVEAVYGLRGVLGGFSPLPGKGTVRLRNRARAILLEVNYSGRPAWPAAADGGGHSLVLGRPSYGQDNPEAWMASALIGGSPGRIETYHADPLSMVVINEFLADANAPLAGYLELYNHSNAALDVSGCVLTDDSVSNKFVLPTGTTIAARGFRTFTAGDLGFSLRASGGTLYFRSAQNTRVLDAVRYEAQEGGVSNGRHPDGAGAFYRLAACTPSAPNGAVRAEDIVINEIMYHPVSEDDEDQYVELYNAGTNSVDLGGWRFVAGIDYEFPSFTRLDAGQYLVIARNAQRLRANYTQLNAANALGNFSGRLAHNGERLALAAPHSLVVTNATGAVTTKRAYVVVDEVSYHAGGRWGKWAAGGGSSLELINPRADRRLAANWADSDETAKAPWTPLEVTGVLDLGLTNFPANLQVFLQDEGECLLDDVEVIGSGGTNLVVNPAFASGIAGWSMTGTHDQSSWETTEGCGDGKSLHIRGAGRGDTGVNRIMAELFSPRSLVERSTATIRTRARWLKGCPALLLRLRGNWLELAGHLTTPINPGTPGLRNSRAVEPFGPAIHGVRHEPVLPSAGEPVTVTAQVEHPDGAGAVVLSYRVDPASNRIAVPMVDDGTGGDEVAGDGVFSATIPGRPTGILVAFSIEATDPAQTTTNTFPIDAPARECLVRFGEPQPNATFPVYRLWITQAAATRWSSRLHLDNTPLDATFVYGAQRVIQNIGACYAGSPFVRGGYDTPTGAPCGYDLEYPADDLFLGVTDLALDWPAYDPALHGEQIACWIGQELDIPYNYRRFIHVYVNGSRRGQIYEDAQRPNSDMLDEWVPGDADGDLHKIDDWFEFADDNHDFTRTLATLDNFTTTGGVKKTARYRWNWRKRAAHGDYDNYNSLFELADAVKAKDSPIYVGKVDSIADVEEWMRVFCVERIVGNWDSYGSGLGKNMYAYKPPSGRWIMIPWDIDFVLSVSGDPPTNPMSLSDLALGAMYQHPVFARAYYRTIHDAVNGPLRDEAFEPLMQAHYAALLANGVVAASSTANGKYLRARRAYLESLLAKVACGFAITNDSGQDFSATNAAINLSGTAPVGVKTIEVNGVAYPITWTTLSNWSLSLPLNAGANVIDARGYDSRGLPFSNALASITVTRTGVTEIFQERVVINEWMAANTRTVADPANGQFEDWFELYNPNSNAVDLAGFSLTDLAAEPTQFVIPAGTTIPPNGFLLVWADDRADCNGPTNRELHVNFKLAQAGEGMALFAPDGTLIDRVQFGAQRSDLSEGRWPDGWAPPFQTMSRPTPGAPNLGDAPRLVDVHLSAPGRLTLKWAAEPGCAYRLESTDSLESGIWQDFGSQATVEGAEEATTIDLESARSRFYRVVRAN